MPLKLSVEIDVSGFKRKDQLPFATALALTRTVQEAQKVVRAELPQHFTLRNSWVSKGIRIARAEKATLEAQIFSTDAFMVKQETGGTKTPAGRSLAIPPNAASIRRVIPAGARPKGLQNKPGVFRATIGGVDGLWQRLRGARTKRRRGERTLKLLWIFKPTVQVQPRFHFVDTVRRVVRERFSEQFKAALAKALATAR